MLNPQTALVPLPLEVLNLIIFSFIRTSATEIHAKAEARKNNMGKANFQFFAPQPKKSKGGSPFRSHYNYRMARLIVKYNPMQICGLQHVILHPNLYKHVLKIILHPLLSLAIKFSCTPSVPHYLLTFHTLKMVGGLGCRMSYSRVKYNSRVWVGL